MQRLRGEGPPCVAGRGAAVRRSSGGRPPRRAKALRERPPRRRHLGAVAPSHAGQGWEWAQARWRSAPSRVRTCSAPPPSSHVPDRWDPRRRGAHRCRAGRRNRRQNPCPARRPPAARGRRRQHPSRRPGRWMRRPGRRPGPGRSCPQCYSYAHGQRDQRWRAPSPSAAPNRRRHRNHRPYASGRCWPQRRPSGHREPCQRRRACSPAAVRNRRHHRNRQNRRRPPGCCSRRCARPVSHRASRPVRRPRDRW